MCEVAFSADIVSGSSSVLSSRSVIASDVLGTGTSLFFFQGSKCPSLPGFTHGFYSGKPGLGFKPYFEKVGT